MKIEFVGGISPELADVIEKNGIDAVCVEGNICEMRHGDRGTHIQKVGGCAGI